MTTRQPTALVIWTVMVCSFLAGADAAENVTGVADLIQQAGNADDDAVRMAVLRRLEQSPDASESLRADATRMIQEIDRWLHDKRLAYFNKDVFDKGAYDFGMAQESALFPLTLLYQGRMLTWVTLEQGGYWSRPDARRAQFDRIRPIFEEYVRRFPKNRIARMYLGEPIPPERIYTPAPEAPDWANHQRETLERLADIIRWWIAHRMQENGEYGGGWGDDCEMWRWWIPVLIGFEDPVITDAQARFSKALLSQKHLAKGYTDHMYDVEHTAEDTSDALTPMMYLEPDNPEWSARAMRLVELMKNTWTGVNDRGFLQFKSTYFNADAVSPDPRKACDTVYHPRAIQPALLYWQRTDDEALGTLFTRWMDTWVVATASSERGKPAGIIPSAIHWPDGAVGGLNEAWWDPGNHTNDPLYVWPSAMGQMTNTLLLAFHMTKEPKYLEPIRSMARIRLQYLKQPSENAPDGNEAWCARRMSGLRDVIAKYQLLYGGADFDSLLALDAAPYVAFRLRGDMDSLVKALRDTADALRINFPGYTSEVRYTDRVLRFPALFGANTMFPDAINTIHTPDPTLLYATATGDPGDGLYFPVSAVRWLTPPRDIAALIVDAGKDRFAAHLFHFGSEPRTMAAEFYLLAPGRYVLSVQPEQEPQKTLTQPFRVTSRRTRVSFALPPKQLCRARVAPASHDRQEEAAP